MILIGAESERPYERPPLTKDYLRGESEREKVYVHPADFSDQYDVGMEYSGYASSWDQVVFRGEPDTGEFIAFWLEGSRVLAGMNVNVWDVNGHVQALIRSGRPVEPEALRDPNIPLESLAGELTT